MDVRLAKFKQKASPLVCEVARRALDKAGVDVSEISKLVVVSSTGFSGPGLDCELIKSLGLPRSVDRTLIGFMGCAAALYGLRVSSDYVTVSSLECGGFCLRACLGRRRVFAVVGRGSPALFCLSVGSLERGRRSVVRYMVALLSFDKYEYMTARCKVHGDLL